MDLTEKEEYSLPIYESPLEYWGIPSDFSTESDDIPRKDETQGHSTDQIVVKLYEISAGRDSIEAIHYREDARIGHYTFNVVDEDARICAYTGDGDDVPWSVRRSIAKFGYYERSTPTSGRTFAFDHLLSPQIAIDRVIPDDAVLLQAVVDHVLSGLTSFALFKSIEHQLPYNQYKQVIGQIAANPLDLISGGNGADIIDSVFSRVYENVELSTPIFFPRADPHTWRISVIDSEPKNESGESDDDQTTYLELTMDEGEEHVFAAHISRYAIDRYRFAPVGEDRLVLQHADSPDLPPYIVINQLTDLDQEITNVPTFSPTASLLELLETTDELVQWILKHFDLEYTETIAAYTRYLYRLDYAFGLAYLYENYPQKYRHARDAVFEPLSLSPSDIDSETTDLPTLTALTGKLLRQFDSTEAGEVETKLNEYDIQSRQEELDRITEKRGMPVESPRNNSSL